MHYSPIAFSLRKKPWFASMKTPCRELIMGGPTAQVNALMKTANAEKNMILLLRFFLRPALRLG